MLQLISLATAGASLIPAALLQSCQSESYKGVFFTSAEMNLIDEIGETILPKTPSSPGAKELKIANFIDTYVADCYTSTHQSILKQGLIDIQERTKATLGRDFLNLQQPQQHELLVILDEETKSSTTLHYFSLIKSLVLFTYFTSEAGMTQLLRYEPIPGKYIGNYPFKQGEKAWAL